MSAEPTSLFEAIVVIAQIRGAGQTDHHAIVGWSSASGTTQVRFLAGETVGAYYYDEPRGDKTITVGDAPAELLQALEDAGWEIR